HETRFSVNFGHNSVALCSNVHLVLNDERTGSDKEKLTIGRERRRSGGRGRDGPRCSCDFGGPRVATAELQKGECEYRQNLRRGFQVHHRFFLTSCPRAARPSLTIRTSSADLH